MPKVTLNNFAILIRSKKIKSIISFKLKELSDNSNGIFQIDSLVNTTKNRETKLFKAVSELKCLTEKNGRDYDKQIFAGETERSNSENGNGRRKIGRRPKFLS